jgi:hypothetical protein
MAKAGVRGFGHKDKETPGAERGWMGHEGAYTKEGDSYGDYEHSQTHREMHKDGSMHVGNHYGRPGNFDERGHSEFDQHLDAMSERFKHKEKNAGVLLAARHDGEEYTHYAENRYMSQGSASGAKKTWKPKGRKAAEKASRDV